jgi:phosphatidylglycerophosphate synthase
MPTEPTGRRPLKSRDLPFFKNLAAGLARVGVTPNAISFFSIVFGVLAGVAFWGTTLAHSEWSLRLHWLLAAVFIQLRLVANLLDGMVAVEGRKGGPTGDLWNEAPDRISDAAIFIGAGYAWGSSPTLGWAAALTAVFVAYVRALGASVGAGQCFLGPQAKPHRMALMTALAMAGTIFPHFITQNLAWAFFENDVSLGRSYDWLFPRSFPVTVVNLVFSLVILGGLITAWRRLKFIANFLRNKTSA